MSSVVGEFTTLSGNVWLPLPVRERGSAGGAGGAAGHAVCGADWAFLIEALAERHSHGYNETLGQFRVPMSFEVRQNAVRQTSGANTVMWFHHGIAHNLAKQMAGSSLRLFLDPDWTPPSKLENAAYGMWSTPWSAGGGQHDHQLVLSQPDMERTPTLYYEYGSQWHETMYDQGYAARISGSFPKRADDVRRMFYDLKRMTRRNCVVSCSRDKAGAVYESRYSTVDFQRHESTSAPTYYNLGSTVLNVRPEITPAVRTGFAIVQAHAWHQHWTDRDTASPTLHGTETVDAWISAPVTLGGSVDFTEWTPAKLKTWAESLFTITGQDDYSAEANVWGDGAHTAAASYTHAYFDMSFPIDAQVFGSSYDYWNWTPHAST